MVPVVNPDGLEAGSRYNGRGIDLNRNFPTNNRINNIKNGLVALSEPESRILNQLILQRRPNRIITFHEALSCIDYDGPARQLAEVMARNCDLPVHKLGAQPGSLGAYAGEVLGIPTVTVELTKEDSSLAPESLWSRYREMLISAVVFTPLP